MLKYPAVQAEENGVQFADDIFECIFWRSSYPHFPNQSPVLRKAFPWRGVNMNLFVKLHCV